MSPLRVKCSFCGAEPGTPCWVHWASSHIAGINGNDANLTFVPQSANHSGYHAARPHRLRVRAAALSRRLSTP